MTPICNKPHDLCLAIEAEIMGQQTTTPRCFRRDDNLNALFKAMLDHGFGWDAHTFGKGGLHRIEFMPDGNVMLGLGKWVDKPYPVAVAEAALRDYRAWKKSP